MPDAHAHLSPSDAERWISCPAAIRMDEQVPEEPESVYAAEGTLAHTLGELKASLEFGKITKEQYRLRYVKWYEQIEAFCGGDDDRAEETVLEMERHTDAYVDLIKERVALFPGSTVLFEVRVHPGVEECWGTSDTIIVSPVHVEVIDFKYGAGVAVEAHGNPQLRLYGLGALEEMADLIGDPEVVRITVHQPRMNHVLTEEITPEALREWRDTKVIPAANLALHDPDAPFGPSDEACRWCPASGQCRAQIEAVFATADFDEKPDVLSMEELAEALNRKKMIQDWLGALEKVALQATYSDGKTIPGYKVVLSGGQRSVQDVEKAIEILVDAGYTEDEVLAPRKVKGIGDLESLLGKDTFKTLLEEPGIVTKSKGKPALAPESDKRPSITPNNEAAAEFGAAVEED